RGTAVSATRLYTPSPARRRRMSPIRMVAASRRERTAWTQWHEACSRARTEGHDETRAREPRRTAAPAGGTGAFRSRHLRFVSVLARTAARAAPRALRLPRRRSLERAR